MVLEVVWANLAQVGPAFLAALATSIGLALLLRRAARRAASPGGRDNCDDCRAAADSGRNAECDQHRALDEVSIAPLALFVACSTFAMLAVGFPDVVSTYIVPFDVPSPTVAEVLLLLFLMCAAGGAVALSAYVLQDRKEHRELLLRGALLASFVGLIVGAVGAGSLGMAAQGLVPAALSILLVALVLEWRARQGRPALGYRSVAAAVAPLFVIALLAAVRIAEILRYASQS